MVNTQLKGESNPKLIYQHWPFIGQIVEIIFSRDSFTNHL